MPNETQKLLHICELAADNGGTVIAYVDGLPWEAKAEHEAQRHSFAYGNASMSNIRITREMVDEEAERDE